MASPLAHLALRYLIGEDDNAGAPGYATEPGYGTTMHPAGLGIGYVNRRQEEGGRKPGIDYKPADDIENEYGEPAPTFGTPYFWKNIDDQAERLKALGFQYVEVDNLDTDTVSQALIILDRMRDRHELGVLVKNPHIVPGKDKHRLIAHPSCIGICVEKSETSARALLDLCAQAGQPDMPIRVVTFEDGLAWAQGIAAQAQGTPDFGVTHSPRGEYTLPITHLLRPDAPAMPDSPPLPPVTSATPWLNDLEEDAEVHRYHDGPDVPMLANQVARIFPEDKALATYCTQAGVGTAWCGIYAANKLSRYGLKPPFKNTGTGGFMYVDSWSDYGSSVPLYSPQAGDLALWINKSGLHHISFYVGGGKYIGGNQGDTVSKTTFPTPSMYRRPPPPVNYVPSPTTMPMLMRNSNGDAVRILQTMLGGIDVDGDFGPLTEAAVKAFQSAHGLEVDGIVGTETWTALFNKTETEPPPPPSGEKLLTPQEINDICQMAKTSSLAQYSWKNRGVAPTGYIQGMAVMFAQCLQKLAQNDSAVLAMTVPIGGPRDALAYYSVVASGRQNILRKLFVMKLGLGMRESSGNYTEGRDMSASNVTADTAEAGCFQQSWNSSTASAEMKKLLPAYSGDKQPCYSNIFKQGITPKATKSYGSGPGFDFQELAKKCPAFAVEMCGVGLRVLYNHWGPVVRQEVEMRAEAEALLTKVANYISPASTEARAAPAALMVSPMETPTAFFGMPSGGLPLDKLGSIPDSAIRFAWPFIQRMSADQIIALKNKVASGDYSMMDLMSILTRHQQEEETQ